MLEFRFRNKIHNFHTFAILPIQPTMYSPTPHTTSPSLALYIIVYHLACTKEQVSKNYTLIID